MGMNFLNRMLQMYQNTERQKFEHSDAEVITYNIIVFIKGFQFHFHSDHNIYGAWGNKTIQ